MYDLIQRVADGDFGRHLGDGVAGGLGSQSGRAGHTGVDLDDRVCSTAASEHSGFAPTTDQGFEGWPLGRVRQPPQSTRASRPLLIRGSKAGPAKGFDSRPRARRVRDDSWYVRYMAEAWAMLPRYPRTFPRPAGAIL